VILMTSFQDWLPLVGADLWGAELRGATYSAHTRWPDGFDPEAAALQLLEGD